VFRQGAPPKVKQISRVRKNRKRWEMRRSSCRTSWQNTWPRRVLNLQVLKREVMKKHLVDEGRFHRRGMQQCARGEGIDRQLLQQARRGPLQVRSALEDCCRRIKIPKLRFQMKTVPFAWVRYQKKMKQGSKIVNINFVYLALRTGEHLARTLAQTVKRSSTRSFVDNKP